MNRLLMAAALIVLAACGGVSTQNGNGTDKEGLNGKVHKVQTLIYNAKSQGNETVKDGKPDSYRETDFFPKEDTRIYNAAGQLDSVVSVVDAVKYITVYAYRDGNVSNEKLFQNGELLGRVLKESAYSEMDDYLIVKEYTYNKKGWLETCVSSDDNKVSYDYPETDDRGNWTRMVITLNGQPYGIAERSITYYE